MKQEQEEEFEENESEQFKGKTYKEILDDLKRLKKVVGHTYIPALCVAYKREHINMEHADIKKQVMKDCLEIGLWKESYIIDSFPKWVNRTYPLNTTKKFNKILNSPEEKQREQTVNVFSDTIEYIEKENQRAKEESETEPTQTRAVEQSEHGGKAPKPTPLELYEHGVRDAEKLWIDLTGLRSLITSDTTDALVDYIKPTDGYRLRIFKGLDQMQSIHYQNCLIRLDMLIQRTLKMCQEINRENKQEVSN